MGRGGRAAAWFQDHINEQPPNGMQSVTLQGGIKGWVAGGEEYIRFIDGYDAQVWAADKA